MKFGSHLYGTNTENSDLDYKEVYIPAARDIILQKVTDVISTSRKKEEGEKNTNQDVDREVYSLQKFLKLVGQGQTVALDMLFAPKEMCEVWTSDWQNIVDNKHKMLSKQYMSFVGYCRQQANKYGIKGSRMAAAKKAVDGFSHMQDGFPDRTKLRDIWGNVETMVKLADNEFMTIDKSDPSDYILDVCGRKCQAGNSLGNAFSMYRKLYEEYGKRARQAMNNEGVDWKALSHAVRIGRQAVDFLQTGHIIFPRPDAVHLWRIKTGQVDYKYVSQEIEELLEKIEKSAETSDLPDKPDYDWMEERVYRLYGRQVQNYLECQTL